MCILCIILCHVIACYILNIDWARARYQKLGPGEKFGPGRSLGRIHCNLFLQDNPIVPGVKFSVTLIPSSTEFHLISGTQDAADKVVVTKIELKVRRINQEPWIGFWAFEQSLNLSPEDQHRFGTPEFWDFIAGNLDQFGGEAAEFYHIGEEGRLTVRRFNTGKLCFSFKPRYFAY